jgi:hypothetical protein
MEKFHLLDDKCNIKGRDLKSLGLQWVAVTNEKMMHNGEQYKIGKNKAANGFTYDGHKHTGFYFWPLNKMGDSTCNGDGYHEVSFDDDENIYIRFDKCKAGKIVLGEKILFNDLSDEICKNIISYDGRSIKHMSDKRKNDPEICKIAAVQNGLSIEYMSEERRNDPEICEIAVTNDGESIEYLNDIWKNDKRICKNAVSNRGYSIRFMSDERKNDPEICRIAAQNNGYSLEFMSKERKNDPEICKLAAAYVAETFKYMSKERRNDPEICKIAVAKNGLCIEYTSKKIAMILKFAKSQHKIMVCPFNS